MYAVKDNRTSFLDRLIDLGCDVGARNNVSIKNIFNIVYINKHVFEISWQNRLSSSTLLCIRRDLLENSKPQTKTSKLTSRTAF